MGLTDRIQRNFSNGKSVDSIETEKSRIILHELETDFWLLAVGFCVTLIYSETDVSHSPLI